MTRIPEKDWEWLGHPGHFICSERCLFRLATRIGNYVVSTVGEFRPTPEADFERVGVDRMFETMVFRVDPSKRHPCGCLVHQGEDVDFEGYNDAASAHAGHMAMCDKYAAIGAAGEMAEGEVGR